MLVQSAGLDVLVHMYQNHSMTAAPRLASTVSTALGALAAPAPPAPPPAPAGAERIHVRRTGRLSVPLLPARAFPLFTPLGERRWAPGWDPLFHFPADGEARAGALFSTRGEDGRETLWVIVDWRPERRRVRYARVTPGLRAGTVEVACAPGPDRTTVATVTYDLAALSPEGDADLATRTESWYAGFLAEWEQQIAAALRGE